VLERLGKTAPSPPWNSHMAYHEEGAGFFQSNYTLEFHGSRVLASKERMTKYSHLGPVSHRLTKLKAEY